MEDTCIKRGNAFTGLLGALIGAIVGIAVWMIVGRLGYIASAVGILAVLVSGKLYDVFGGKPGALKILVLIICVLITVFGGTFGNYYWQAWDIYDDELEECVELYKKYYDADDAEARAESEIIMDESYGGRAGHFKLLMEQPENREAFFKDLMAGLAYALIGCVIFGGRKLITLRGHREVRTMAETNAEADKDTED